MSLQIKRLQMKNVYQLRLHERISWPVKDMKINYRVGIISDRNDNTQCLEKIEITAWGITEMK